MKKLYKQVMQTLNDIWAPNNNKEAFIGFTVLGTVAVALETAITGGTDEPSTIFSILIVLITAYVITQGTDERKELRQLKKDFKRRIQGKEPRVSTLRPTQEELNNNPDARDHLKSGVELYLYCLENKTGEGMTRNSAVKHFDLASASLYPEDEVVTAFIGLHNTGRDGKPGVGAQTGAYAYVVTQDRIIVAQQRFFGRSHTYTVNLDMLNDVQVHKRLLSMTITFDTMKERFSVYLGKHSVGLDNAIHQLQRDVRKHKNKETQVVVTNQISKYEELGRLKELLDNEVLNQEEYEQEREKLLGNN